MFKTGNVRIAVISKLLDSDEYLPAGQFVPGGETDEGIEQPFAYVAFYDSVYGDAEFCGDVEDAEAEYIDSDGSEYGEVPDDGTELDEW
jgi:hypothetical protein